MEEFDIPEDEYISAPSLDQAFKKAQDFVESKNFDGRIYLYKYDSVTNYQRFEVYKLRDSLLENPKGFEAFVQNAIIETVENILALKEPNLITQELNTIFGLKITGQGLTELNAKKTLSENINEWFNPVFVSKRPLMLKTAVNEIVKDLIEQISQLKADQEVYSACQNLILQIIDQNWSGHLELMDILKEEAGLFSYASEDPLIDYILESRKLFEHMGTEIQKQFLRTVFGRINQK
jgi:preprotein translocase subunit SecA